MVGERGPFMGRGDEPLCASWLRVCCRAGIGLARVVVTD